FVELLRHLSLLARESARGRLIPRRHRLSQTRQEALRLCVDRSLFLRHVLQLLQHVREAGRRVRRVGLLAVARQRRRRAIERVRRVAEGTRRLLAASGVGRRLQRLTDLLLRFGDRSLGTAREQRRLLAFLLQTLGGVVEALLDRALRPAQVLGLRLSGARLL